VDVALPINPPELNFLQMQRDYLRNNFIHHNSNNNKNIEDGSRDPSVEFASRLHDALSTPEAEDQAIREAGCYYTPISKNVKLWEDPSFNLDRNKISSNKNNKNGDVDEEDDNADDGDYGDDGDDGDDDDEEEEDENNKKKNNNDKNKNKDSPNVNNNVNDDAQNKL